MTLIRSRGRKDPLELQAGNNVLELPVAELLLHPWLEGVCPHCKNNSSDLELHILGFLIVLHGPERWFVGEVVDVVRSGFLGGEEGLETVDGPRGPKDQEGRPLGRVLDEARTLPMFASRQAFLYRVPALPGEDVDRLVEYAKSPPAVVR